MSKDKIVIIRHGKPALSRKVKLTWRGYRDWWQKYDEGGLDAEQNIPQELKALAAEADLIISSPLLRARETAELLAERAPDLIDDELVEAALPPPHLGFLKFRPKTWGVLARVVWFVGWSDGMESHRAARARAARMGAKISEHATDDKLVLVTAHGWYNRMLKGWLMKNGWNCVSQNGDLHWSRRIFERK